MKGKSKDLLEKFYPNLIRVLPQSVYLKDLEGVIVECSDEQAKAVGLKDASEMIGKTAYDTLPKVQADKVTAVDKKVIRKKSAVCVEEVSQKADGTTATYLSYKIPLKDENDHVLGLLGVSFDITARKKAEEESRKAKEQLDRNNQAKAKFLRVLQHDLRNKLTGILSFSELLLDALDDKVLLKNGLNIINRAAKSIIPTLDRINNYLSLETGQLKPYHSTFNLSSILKSFEEKYKPGLIAKGLSMEFEMDSKMEGRFIGDSLLIYDVIDHLIANAIKYTDKGKITIETHLIRKKGENVWLDIVVRDTGRGMSQRVLDNIFNLFDHDPHDESKKYTTPGINLSISKKIAELLEGDLMVDSRDGIGTDFTFYVKLKIAKPVEKQTLFKSFGMESSLGEEELETEFNKEKFQVLIVEDDPTNLEAMQALLSTYFHCNILSAMDLKKAKQSILDHPSIDLILTDIQLPDGEGHELMPYLYKLHPSDENLPWVVAVTAFAREIDMDYFCDQGIVNVISKPITLEQLTEVIHSLFGDKVIKKKHRA